MKEMSSNLLDQTWLEKNQDRTACRSNIILYQNIYVRPDFKIRTNFLHSLILTIVIEQAPREDLNIKWLLGNFDLHFT